MNSFDETQLNHLYIPGRDSHKGQNGKVLVIGGSHLFHSASLWALSIASKIVDMVFYASVPENNEIVLQEKKEFRNGIVVSRSKVEEYIEEADSILIGPGLPREEGKQPGDDDTRQLTKHLLTTYPHKKWIIDGGSLQVINPNVLPKHAIVTPHHKEFLTLFGEIGQEEVVISKAREFDITILAKGEIDIVASPEKAAKVVGGNAGMTKGGTGDVLAGLVAALYAQNDDGFLVASCASFLNKKAGESLFKRVGYYFNASDLVEEIPHIMKKYVLS